MNHYELLGVPRGASLDDIKSAFRKHAKNWHPDNNARPDAAERFRAYAEAYEVLRNSFERARYDESLRHEDGGFEQSSEQPSYEMHGRQSNPPELSPLERLFDDWNEKLKFDPALLVALYAKVDAWVYGRVARKARHHS